MPYIQEGRYIGLWAPQAFLDSSYIDIKAICNGCGPQTSKFDFVPDSIYGLKIGTA